MQASALGRDAPRAGPANLYLALSGDPDRPLETKASVARTGLLAVAATALIAGPPLYWAAAADGATAPVATLATKDAAASGECPPDDGPSGDDADGTTAPGMTTTVGAKDTSNNDGVTSAPGVTTAPGATSAGGKTANKSADTTLGEDTSTQPGQLTSDGGRDTGTTAGETDEAGVGCPPEKPAEQPPVTPPEQPPVTPPGQPQVTPPAAVPPAPQPAPPVVAPVQARAAPTARLAPVAGCPPQPFFARVTGRGITKVTFTLDGRRLKTLTRPDSRGVWKVRVNPAGLSVGKHRIVARASFSAADRRALRQAGQPAAKVLTVTFSKCARKASRPTFAG